VRPEHPVDLDRVGRARRARCRHFQLRQRDRGGSPMVSFTARGSAAGNPSAASVLCATSTMACGVSTRVPSRSRRRAPQHRRALARRPAGVNENQALKRDAPERSVKIVERMPYSMASCKPRKRVTLHAGHAVVLLQAPLGRRAASWRGWGGDSSRTSGDRRRCWRCRSRPRGRGRRSPWRCRGRWRDDAEAGRAHAAAAAEGGKLCRREMEPPHGAGRRSRSSATGCGPDRHPCAAQICRDAVAKIHLGAAAAGPAGRRLKSCRNRVFVSSTQLVPGQVGRTELLAERLQCLDRMLPRMRIHMHQRTGIGWCRHLDCGHRW